MAPKIDPGGLRRPLASQLGAWSLPKLLPEPSGASKKFYDRARGRPGAPPVPFFIEKKTWLSWNGKREKRKTVKHCRQGESSESRKNSKRRSARTTERSKTRVARAARESRQQARTIAYALARPLRGLAGRFELGAFRSVF